MNAQKIKERFDFYTANHEGIYPPSAKGRGVYVGILNKVCKGDANRKLVLKYLTGKTSTKVLSDAEWCALKKFCDISPVELERFIGLILGEVVKVEGQLDFTAPAPLIAEAAHSNEFNGDMAQEVFDQNLNGFNPYD